MEEIKRLILAWEEYKASLELVKNAVSEAEEILRGFALLGQDGDLQAAAEWLEKYGGLK